MKGRFDDDKGKGECEGACKNGYGKQNNNIKVTRRRFIKTTAALGAAVAGIPYNLTDITDIFLKEDGKLIMYPYIHEYNLELVHEPFKKHFISVHLWGCNWNCRWCPLNLKKAIPIAVSINQITDLLLNFDEDATTMLAISGGEPLLQQEEVLKLIDSLKMETNYSLMLVTNGSLMEENFIEKANTLGLDRINISFRHRDDEWHKWYTRGHSNQNTINALKLVSEKFEGLTAVSLIPFSCIDVATFKDICEFLHDINPDFAIKIFCPRPHREREKCEKIRHELEEIALSYFKRVDRSFSLSKQFKRIEYKIVEDGGGLNLVKNDEWEGKKEVMTRG